MLGLIVAGGKGTRFGTGEKPLALCGGRPMIERVADALAGAGLEVVVVASSFTPFTQNWCRAHDLLCVCTSGQGYVEDLAEAAALLAFAGPVVCVSADLPCLTTDLVLAIIEAHAAKGLPALSVWVPAETAEYPDVPCVEVVEGRRAVPAGINILEGSRMGEEQEEARLLLDDPRIHHNVNTLEALNAADAFLAASESPGAQDCDHRKKDIDRSMR